MNKYKCCICGKECFDGGNNPWPIIDDAYASCCDDCNYKYVIPARLGKIIVVNEEKKK